MAEVQAYSLLMQAPGLVAILRGREGCCALFNPMFRTLWSGREAHGQPMREAFSELEGQGWFEMVETVYDTGEAFHGHNQPAAADWDGSGQPYTRYFDFVYAPHRSADGAIDGVMLFGTDVTARTQAQQAVREKEALLQSVIDSTPELIYAKDREGRMIVANKVTLQSIGQPASVVMNNRASEWHADKMRAAAIEASDRDIMERGEDLIAEHSVTLPTGTFTFSSVTSPLRNEAGKVVGVVGSSRDISALKAAELALLESESRFRQLADAVPQMVWVALPDGYHEYYNQRWYEFTGALPGSTDGDGWATVLHPDDRERARNVWDYSLATGGPYEIEYRLCHHNGDYRWVLGRALPIRNDAGEIVKWYGTCTDIHDQKAAAEILEQTVEERTAALAEMAQDLQRSNRELDQFAYAASHDMQEPLRKIRVFAARLEERHGDALNADARFHLDRIVASAERMSTMVDDLLNFSRLSAAAGAAQKEPTDLGSVVRGVLGDFELAIQQRHAVVNVGTLPVIDAVPLQMTQLFYNLIGNALKFVRNGETPQVRIESRRLEGEPIRYEISVTDMGIGFAQQYAERVFEVFNRLNGRSEYEGSGIGLALCKRIAEAHAGSISAESTEGGGTVFKVLLPAIQPALVVDNLTTPSHPAS